MSNIGNYNFLIMKSTNVYLSYILESTYLKKKVVYATSINLLVNNVCNLEQDLLDNNISKQHLNLLNNIINNLENDNINFCIYQLKLIY